MAEQIAASALVSNTSGSSSTSSSTTPTSTSVLSQTLTKLGNSCQATLQALMQSIPASATWAPQFQSDSAGPVSVSAAVNLSGTYQIQGYLVDTGISTQGTPNTTPTPSPLLMNDSISISSSGAITSSDGTISGTLSGSLLNLSIHSSNTRYNLASDIRALGTSILQTGTTGVWSAVGGGTATMTNPAPTGATTQVATVQDAVRFDLVLTPSGSQPNWSGLVSALMLSNSDNSSLCTSPASPISVMARGHILGGLHAPLCLSSNATGISLSAPNLANTNPVEDVFNLAMQNTLLPTLTLTESSTATPFILTGTATTLTINAATYNLSSYYVLGSKEIIYNLSTPATANQAAISVNGSLVLDGEAFLGINANTTTTGTSSNSGGSSSITLTGLAGGH